MSETRNPRFAYQSTTELKKLLGRAAREALGMTSSDDELWALFRSLKQLEVALAVSTGGILTYGLDSMQVVPSKRLKKPYLRRATSSMVLRYLQLRPDLVRLSPSSDEDENIRRILAALKALFGTDTSAPSTNV